MRFYSHAAGDCIPPSRSRKLGLPAQSCSAALQHQALCALPLRRIARVPAYSWGSGFMMASSLKFLDFTVTSPDVKPRRVLVRERYQDVTVKDFRDKWRIDYWDYTTTPRTKRGKKWSKKYVPTKREAQKLADEFMEQVNERNNSPHLCSNDGDTFASLAKMYKEKISCHLRRLCTSPNPIPCLD